MKYLAILACLILAACGEQSTPVSTVSTVPVVSGDGSQKFGLVVYIGDDLTAQYCSVPLTAPYAAYQFEEPNGVCLGAEGETSEGTAARFAQAVDMHPAAIVLETGLNDVRDGYTDQHAIAAMIREAQAVGIVMVVGTLPPSAGVDVKPWNDGIRQLVAATGASLSDYYAVFIDPSVSEATEFFPELLTAPRWTTDGVYPSAAGYQLMWGIVCEPLDPLGVFAE